MWWRELVCRVLGHRDIKEIPHGELSCHAYGGHGLESTHPDTDAFCLYCDSGWL